MNKGLKAGIFVVVVVVLLLVSWVWLGRIEFGKGSYEAIINFPDVTGLKINDPVRVWGIEKGKVRGMEFKSGYIEVKVLLDKEVELFSDVRASILDVAMISGTKYVKLDPGKSGIPFDLKNPIPGEASLGIPLSLIGDLGNRVNSFFSIVEDVNLVNSLGSILKNLQETTFHLSRIVKENENNLRDITRGLKEDSRELSLAVSHVDSLVYEIKNGKGTIGKLVNEDSLYIELQTTLSAIKELAEDIKENPKKYLKIF